MFRFHNQTIFILSPEAWGIMRISKHHYAIELVRMGNRVYFIDPPDLKQEIRGSITETPEGVRVVRYKPFARGRRILGGRLFTWLQSFQLRRRILKSAGRPDVVWCFDMGTFDDLDIFGARLRIFHPVDHNMERTAPRVAGKADFVFSTSPRILEYMKRSDQRGIVVQHGLNGSMEQYAQAERERLTRMADTPPFRGTIGFWGSLFKESLDTRKILRLVEAYPAYSFHFWGAHNLTDNNLTGRKDRAVMTFIDSLKAKSNVCLRGVRSSADFCLEISEVDMFINIEFEYSLRWDNGNPHKIMEYLATGKPVFSTPVIMYADKGMLFESAGEDVVEDMRQFLSEWEHWAGVQQRLRRIDYALSNTYRQQLGRIEAFVSGQLESSASPESS
jgi:hypothetical protein